MATLVAIVEKAKGTAGAWQVRRDDDDVTATLYHHGTAMMTWDIDSPAYPLPWTGLGWGSVSDQQGMNKALRVLGIPMVYRRDRAGGGARYEGISVPLPPPVRWQGEHGLVKVTYDPRRKVA